MLLLQSSDAQAIATGGSFVALIVGIFFFFIGLIVAAMIFGGDRRVRNQQAQIFLLMELWKKQGVSIQELQQFRSRFKIKF